ncbi:MAG: HD domain-containing protein [Candidatus Carbobacillus altaicus]|nr:HD domain-containing protein [Candidatus Carbobacillus altaicus]
MDKASVIQAALAWIRKVSEEDATGHDYWHLQRVLNTALYLAEQEGADPFIVALAALFHDLPDDKLTTDPEAKEQEIIDWLKAHDAPDHDIDHIMEIIRTQSYRGGAHAPMRTLEGACVQDADRLDAMGAIGIARTFQYAGARGNRMYDPDLPPRVHMTPEMYRHGRSTAINHFYEKMLKLYDLLNTETARKIGRKKHAFMVLYLETFFEEWNMATGENGNAAFHLGTSPYALKKN